MHAMAERRWDQAAHLSPCFDPYANRLQVTRWEQARALIDLGDIYSQRGKPGDEGRAREGVQQSLEMFGEMEAGGYVTGAGRAVGEVGCCGING